MTEAEAACVMHALHSLFIKARIGFQYVTFISPTSFSSTNYDYVDRSGAAVL